MGYYVYMLKSTNKNNVTYVGYTKNLQKRLTLHNSSRGAKFTRGRSWKIIYKKRYLSKIAAMKNEYILKNNRSKRYKIKNDYLKKI